MFESGKIVAQPAVRQQIIRDFVRVTERVLALFEKDASHARSHRRVYAFTRG